MITKIGKNKFSRNSTGFGTWMRTDALLLDTEGEIIETIFSAGKNDTSPLYKKWESGKYNPECSCCWLNFGHTEDRHYKNIKERETI